MPTTPSKMEDWELDHILRGWKLRSAPSAVHANEMFPGYYVKEIKGGFRVLRCSKGYYSEEPDNKHEPMAEFTAIMGMNYYLFSMLYQLADVENMEDTFLFDAALRRMKGK